MTLSDTSTETDTQAVIPDATKFLFEDSVYFGLWKSDKSGLYQFTKYDEGLSYALILHKRFHTVSVSSITRGGTGNLTATLTTATKHGLVANDVIVVTGASQSAYNGTFLVASAPTTSTLTYTMASDPAATASGTLKCTTASYSLHTPYAAFGAGPNMYASFDNDGTSSISILQGNNSPTYSSNAVIETVYITGGAPESRKEWPGFITITEPLASSCAISICSRVDNATSYDSATMFTLDTSNDQTYDGAVADTYWRREWVSAVGRTLQTMIRFISNSSTSKPTLNNIGIMSKDIGIYG